MAARMAAVLCLWAGPAAAERGGTFDVFPLGFADAETSLEAARAVVGDSGVVILDRRHHRLLVRADAEKHEQLRRLLAQLNVTPPNVYIEVEYDDAYSAHERGASLGVDGEIVVENGDVSARVDLQPSVVHRTERGSSLTRQSLLVASGREASLRVGERVPWIRWINRWGLRHGLYESEIVWQDVGAFLVVQATVIGEGPMIRIRLVPELSGRVDGNPHRIRYTQAATEVTVADGQTVSLGGLANRDEFFSRFLVGYDRSGGHRTLDIRLTPRLSSP